MMPYYQDDAVTIYHGDARDWDGRADVLVTDPPYGIGLVTKSSDYRDSDAFDNGASLRASVLYDDDPDTVRAMVRDVIPLLIQRADRAVIFPGPAMLWAYPEPRSIGCVFTMAGAGRTAWGFQCMHPVLFYGKDPYLVDGKGGRPNSMKDDQPNRESFDHPCPKPLSWMRWAIGRASRPGEVIVDPFAGTGTTLLAAKEAGRRAIGIEIEERYCEIAANRCSQEVLGLIE